VLMGAANRDPEVFDQPERLDITRPNRAEHLSLAFGPHFCLGAALARLEGEIVFTTLVTRFPQARLLTDDIRYGGSAMLRAIQHLPADLGRP
jgi:cytochrome P450